VLPWEYLQEVKQIALTETSQSRARVTAKYDKV